MSQEVFFTEKDYITLLRWFELAFAKNNDPSTIDRNTFTKLSAMAMSHIDELRQEEKDDVEDES